MELARIVQSEVFEPLGDFVLAGVDYSGSNPVVEVVGDSTVTFALASVSKFISSIGFLIAFEEGLFDYDDVVLSLSKTITVRHLLSHASGLPFDIEGRVEDGVIDSLFAGSIPFDQSLIVPPVSKRIYSNLGFELLCRFVEDQSQIDHFDYIREAIFAPLAMKTMSMTTNRYLESGRTGGAARMVGSAGDLIKIIVELLEPSLFQSETLAEAIKPQFPQLSGVLPGFGRYANNTFGLGFEVHGDKSPHWMSDATSNQSYGHFGQSGVFIWIDPVLRRGLIFLAERDFGPEQRRLWPILSERFATS